MSPVQLKMQQAADALLDQESSPLDLREAAQSLRSALGALAAWDEEAPGNDHATELASGVAISPADAARCILDHQRTACFLRGTLAAITAVRATTSSPIEVLYAGCGPLAPLAIALCHRLAGVRFWPVDIHPANVDSVRRLIGTTGYAGHFGEVVAADACRHQWPVSGQVAVVEVMQRALEKEPQIAVTANVARQLVAGGRLVPASVRLDLQLYDPDTEFAFVRSGPGSPADRVRVPLAPLLDLRADTAEALAAGRAVEITVNDERRLPLMVTTRITVHENIVLADHDSGLTMPWIAHDLGRLAPGTRVQVGLTAGSLPHLVASAR